MRVLQINVRAKGGSVGKIINSLNDRCKSENIDFYIAYGRGDANNVLCTNCYQIGDSNEIKIHALKSRLFGKTATYSRRGTRRLITWIDEIQPDIIHLHGAYGYYVNMGILFDYIKYNDIPLVSTLHSCWDFTGHCCYFDYPKCDNWKTGCHHCIRVHDYPECIFNDSTNKNLLWKKNLYHQLNKVKIVTPSRWLQDLCEQSVLGDLPVMTINNGIDTAVYKKIDIEKKAKPTILCIANIWSKRKGLDDIIELAKYLEDRADIMVVGVNDQQINSLPSNVKGIKRTESVDDLIQLYNAATIFFNPTYEENYPTVNLEAVACHLPVATYDTGGCIETIQKEKYGIIIDPKDYKAVEDYLMNVHYGKIKYEYKDLSFLYQETMADEYIALYKDMLI